MLPRVEICTVLVPHISITRLTLTGFRGFAFPTYAGIAISENDAAQSGNQGVNRLAVPQQPNMLPPIL